MDHDLKQRLSIMTDHKRLNKSRGSSSSSSSSSSSLFNKFAISFATLLVGATLVLMTNFSMQPQTIEVKRLIPNLPLSYEKEGVNEKLQAIDHVFSESNLNNKFHRRVIEFTSDGCEVNFIMTWISSAEFFGNREVLAIESVFNSHPHGCLIILSETMDSPQGNTILNPFLDHGYRVVAVTPDLPFLLKRTAGESWLDEIKSGKRDSGKIPLAQNLSNLMRLAYLYRYGGVYLDTDMIVLRTFKGLRNVIGAQTLDPSSTNWTRLNNAVLIFDKNHPLLLKCIEEFAQTFDGNIWGHNGPYLMSRVARAVEGWSGYDNFTVMRPSVFYPVNWLEIDKLFKVPKTERDSKWVKTKFLQMQRRSHGLHLWNKFSSKYEIEEGSAMWRLVSDHCIFCSINHSITL